VPPFLTSRNGEQIVNVWFKTREEKLRSLLADEAKNSDILKTLYTTVKQLQAKSGFRIALLNQLLDEEENDK